MMSTSPISLFGEWRDTHYRHKRAFTSYQTSYIDGILPEIVVQLDAFEILDILQKRLGNEQLVAALKHDRYVPGPREKEKNGNWIKKSNIVGVNVRTLGNFFNVVKYLLTLPSFHDSIHLLPVWEPGVVASLYGKTAFNINPEFYSEEWANAVPALNTAHKQLIALINIAHALGKSIGMDVIPHTDRFAEMVFTHPRNFEWVKRVGGKIIDHSEHLYRDVEEIIWLFLHRRGTANNTPISYSRNIFFNTQIPILTDKQRTEILFGFRQNYEERVYRRIDLMNELIANGLETLPMTIAPPYRGLHIDTQSFTYDDNGNRWFDYKFNEPQPMSRVFGSLTRYKFFETKKDSWDLDFDQPNKSAWDFIGKQYLKIQQEFNFDFMRGDMAHVQPRPDGVPVEDTAFYDPLLHVKKCIAEHTPHFAFYAETFLAPPGTMGYGDELDHLEKIEADATLGDLQSLAIGTSEFREKFIEYLKISKERSFKPSFTIITGDRDDPRFDSFYQVGNVFRYFVGVLFNGLPSYYAMGFETREQNLQRNFNETYSKLYVYKIQDKTEVNKFSGGPYQWGKNESQFREILKIRRHAEIIWAETSSSSSYIIKYPDEQDGTLIWTQYPDLRYVFVANFSGEKDIDEHSLANYLIKYSCELIYAGKQYGKHECRIYKIQ